MNVHAPGFLNRLMRGFSGAPQASRAAAPPPEAVSELDQLIEHVASLVTSESVQSTRQRALAFAKGFETNLLPEAKARLFVYHAPMPPGRLRYRDAIVDSEQFDHVPVLEHFIERAHRFAPQAQVVLVTSPDSAVVQLASSNVAVVQLPVDAEHAMYSRAVAMWAYVLSSAFTCDTAFLDSDAFLNAPLEKLFGLRFDVALTYRNETGLMPINEGVILASAGRVESVQDFFARFVATYDRAAADPAVKEYYGQIRSWRGGQLSLNALAYSHRPFTPYGLSDIGRAVVRFLPCDTFNYSWQYGAQVDSAEFKDRMIVHLKGARKTALPALRAALPAPEERAQKYSLDTTEPVDYEPEGNIDYASATLTEVADHFRTDKGSLKHRYTEIYERYLTPWRGKPVDILEIGVACGASLKTWACWIGKDAKVTGIDIRPACAQLCKGYPAIEIFVANATTWRTERSFDIVVDDGSHVSLEIVNAYRNLWPAVRSGGYYIIEDLRCTYDPNYAHNFTFAMDSAAFRREHFTAWLDDLLKQLDMGANAVEFVHFYPQLLVIKKR